MNTIRIIPRLDVKGPNLVKGIHLEGLRVLGIPEKFSKYYYHDGADELIYIDTVASLYGRNNLEDIVKRTAENVFIPITVGGGVRSTDDIRRLLRAGADKVAINTEAINNPRIITEGAKVFGSQCIVISIQAMKVANGKYEVYTDNAREPAGINVIDWVRQVVGLGAGEILVTSIDKDGTGEGYELELVEQIVGASSVPVIACGGAGNVKHVEELIAKCGVDAVCAASLFHYNVIRELGIEKSKEGNLEFLKKFKSLETSVLKRVKPVSVSGLKGYLKKRGVGCVTTETARSFTNEQENVKNDVVPKMKGKLPVVTIVDYGGSNLFSVKHAFESIGAKVDISSDPDKIIKADKLVIAGVGAFGDAIEDMRGKGIVDSIKEFVDTGRPVLGVCLGMQLFMTEGEEFGFNEGIGLVKGKVVNLNGSGLDQRGIKVPHVGWNKMEYPKEDIKGVNWLKTAILRDILPGDYVYFVHSYVVVPTDPACIIAETNYGPNNFCSVILKDNIIGCQFHPEKSGIVGLKIYRNFILHCE